MRKIGIYLGILLLAGTLSAQEWPGNRENITVCTDRSIYVSGEKILFSAVIGNSIPYAASRIFYCELVAPDGDPLSGGKYIAADGAGNGCLQVPEETLTGIYYLKSYTRAMRNLGPEHYHYIPLKIIHPFKEEVLSGSFADTLPISRPEVQNAYSHKIEIQTNKKDYSARESLSVRLKGLDPAGDYCLAVVPEATDAQNIKVPVSALSKINGNGWYYPETRGVSVTGNVRDSQTGKSVPGTMVNLSLLGERDMMATMTDSSGRFFFALPDLAGSRDVFLSALAPGDREIELRVDNDFCPRPVLLPSPPFSLDEKEKEAAYRLLVNHAVSKAFRNPIFSSDSGKDTVKSSFYGEPSQVLLIDKYIELPTLEEYFNELPLAVKVRTSRGKKYFRFFSTQAEMNIYDPLVLIDWVAVTDMESIMAINPLAIDRIELVNAPYVKGNMIYGGIISLVSRNKDFAGIDLPSSGTFINYRILSGCRGDPRPESLPENIPDTRNTLHWHPDVKADEEGRADIFLNAPDTPGGYVIVLRELNTGAEMKAGFDVK